MKALIMSAGKGTRLRPLTDKTPKPMIEIGGRPVLEHLLFHLSNYGITRVIVNLHYKPEKIMNYFGDRLLYSYEPTLLGEEGTIKSLTPWLHNEYTVVMNGDTLTNIDINQMFTMSGGQNVRYMDGKIYAGTKIIGPQYFRGNTKFGKYHNADAYWYDIGTHKGLERARNYFEKD